MKRPLHIFVVSLPMLLLLATQTLAQRPQLSVQTGHTESIHSVAFAPGEQLLASGSEDGTVKLWDVASGRELLSLAAPSFVNAVAFSPDGKLLVGVGGGPFRIWEVATGKEARTFESYAGTTVSLAFSPDGRTLASGHLSGLIKLWDVATGQELRILNAHKGTVNSLVFRGDVLASASSDKTIILWDAVTGRKLREIAGHSREVEVVAFAPNGKTLASGGRDSTLRVWDAETGRELHRFTTSEFRFNAIAFSLDGKTLVSGSSSRVSVWEIESGRELRHSFLSFGGEGTALGHMTEPMISSLALSSDGSTVACGTMLASTIYVANAFAGEKWRRFKGHAVPIYSIALSRDGRTLASGGHGSNVKLWDFATGREPRTFKADSFSVNSLAFSPDDSLLAGATDETVKVWDVATGKEKFLLAGHTKGVNTVAFSPDGKALASASDDGTIRFWDASSGRESRVFKRHSGAVNVVVFSPDGKLLASGGKDGTIRLWDAAQGSELRVIKVEKPPDMSDSHKSVDTLVFSRDGRVLAGMEKLSLKLWDVETGRALKIPTENYNTISALAFSRDGKALAGDFVYDLKVLDPASGRELWSQPGQGRDITDLAFSADDRILITAGRDAAIKLWDASSGRELATLLALDAGDWLVVTPDGLFDGSPAAWRQILWRFSPALFDVYPVEGFFEDFYYPGLLADIFDGKRPAAAQDIARKDRRAPHIGLELSAKYDGSRYAFIKLSVTDAPAGAEDVRLFRNGSLVKVWRGDVLKGQMDVTLVATVPVVKGENSFTAYAFNRENIKSGDATLAITSNYDLKSRGTARILAIGVNSYANPQYDLKYAVADARAFAEEVGQQQERAGQFERVEVVALYDRDATKGNILRAFAQLGDKAQPEDVLIVYFAGHGTAHRNKFYLIPHDLGYAGARDGIDQSGLDEILAHSISDRELEEAFERIDAGQILFVIDACNSGQALEAEEKRRGPMNSKGLAQLAYEKGMYILTAAQSYQLANETPRLGHGFLTYALIDEGLKKAEADEVPPDGQISAREWFNFATERVPQIHIEQMKLGDYVGAIKLGSQANRGVRLVKLKDDDVQRPRVFYRRELEAQPFVVAKSGR